MCLGSHRHIYPTLIQPSYSYDNGRTKPCANDLLSPIHFSRNHSLALPYKHITGNSTETITSFICNLHLFIKPLFSPLPRDARSKNIKLGIRMLHSPHVKKILQRSSFGTTAVPDVPKGCLIGSLCWGEPKKKFCCSDFILE